MEIEYIGELLPDGHLSVASTVLENIQQGKPLKITINPLADSAADKFVQTRELDPAAKRFLSRLENAPNLGLIKGNLTREDIYEDMVDEKF